MYITDLFICSIQCKQIYVEPGDVSVLRCVSAKCFLNKCGVPCLGL